MIGYSRAGMACTPNIMFTDDSFEVTLPVNTVSGEVFTKCVQLISVWELYENDIERFHLSVLSLHFPKF